MQDPWSPEEGVRSPGAVFIGSWEMPDVGAGNKLKPAGRAGSARLLIHFSSPTKNTVELFLGHGPSTKYQEVCDMKKKKSVEFNLNIPESPTEHQQPNLDQLPTNVHTILKEHVKPYPVRSVYPKSCYSLCL